MLLAASVFLCLLASCGIPTYLVPDTCQFSAIKTGSETLSFELTYKSADLGADGRVGLLLLYSVDTTTPQRNKDVVSAFKSSYIPTQYNGTVVNVNEGVPVVSVEEDTIKYYALTLDSNLVSAPEYTCALDNDGSFSNKFELDYNSETNTITILQDGTDVGTLGFDSALVPSADQYITLYGAVSVQSPNYSNLYWSDLNFLQYIRIE